MRLVGMDPSQLDISVQGVEPSLFCSSFWPLPWDVYVVDDPADFIVFGTKNVTESSQTRLAKLVGYRINSKSLPYVLVANAIELCYATHPPQHSHLHDANPTFRFLAGRPTLGTIKRDRAYYGLVDLWFKGVWDLLVTQHTCQ
ncbi:hypothetical protein Y032_0041g395 [Ancylostoma ceylanicum]|uniref:Uncharacterized protein n=1 Tax=Ancylostoma ceylanicum TaxID=53326 RepID=A0A016UHV6_9BILA|nr:hypothetical protein Y032_0041g395 [Ancylostoma ceylanicum]